MNEAPSWSDQQHHVERVVGQSSRFWKRAGVPRARRTHMAEELREHLLDASADGRPVQDVVGPDTVAFAASWANVARDRPWTERLLSAVSIVALASGLMSFIGPVIEGSEPGLSRTALVFLGLGLGGYIGGELFRSLRDRLTTQQATAIALGGLLLAAVLGGVLLSTTPQGDLVFAVSPAAAMTLVVAGLAAQALLWWLRRTPR